MPPRSLAGVFRVTVKIQNQTPLDDGLAASRDEALMQGLVSTHTVLSARDGEFVSHDRSAGAHIASSPPACRNVGCWPVLVGDEGDTDTMLSAPIILYDYPQIAPESPGELFDGTEIDEILTLRIMTLTDDEKAAMAAVDERARAVLARTESLEKEQMLGLHGTFRGLQPLAGRSKSWITGTRLSNRPGSRPSASSESTTRVGDRVRLWPLGDADILDMALKGKTATIASIEQDFEDRVYLAVTVDDDPGHDLGMPGKARPPLLLPPRGSRAAGRRRAEELIMPPRILIAGIGNIFLGDDAFGVEVVQRLAERTLPENVRVIDFGIRGFDLTMALLEDLDLVILVDAAPRGGAPGTLYVIEPDPDDSERARDRQSRCSIRTRSTRSRSSGS